MKVYRQPKLAADCIIRVGERIVLIARKNEPLGWALPGGFVDEGETVERAVRREMMEETGLELADLSQFHVYSDPERDPRWHCVSVVFTARGVGEPQAGDDAGEIRLVRPDEVLDTELVFDHALVLRDYRERFSADSDDNQAG